MKKIAFIFLIIVIAGLVAQFYGGRDFTQIPLAWNKYEQSNNFSSFLADIGIIISGERIVEPNFVSPQMADKIIYRWVDKLGQVQFSERRPDVENYQEIRLGDISVQTQPGMSQEEIDKILKKN